MQAKDIQKTLEANGVPFGEAVAAARVIAKELRDSKSTRSPEDQIIVSRAWESMSNEVSKGKV